MTTPTGSPLQAHEPRLMSLDDLHQLRAGMAEQGRALPGPDMRTIDHMATTVPVRLYMPTGSGWIGRHAPPLLVFLHGGGWILGDLDTHDACCRLLVEASGCAVLAAAYRLAPEHPFPAGLHDCLAVWQWARENAAAMDCDPGRIALGGESAGANLAAAVTLMLRDLGEDQPLFQLLVHPATDLCLQQPSIDEVVLPGLTRPFLEECVRSYIKDASPQDPLVSPLRSNNLSNLAPAVVVTVEIDPLRDDGEHYGLALARAGNPVCLQRLPGLPHGFMFLSADKPEIQAAFRLIGDRVAQYFRQP